MILSQKHSNYWLFVIYFCSHRKYLVDKLCSLFSGTFVKLSLFILTVLLISFIWILHKHWCTSLITLHLSGKFSNKDSGYCKFEKNKNYFWNIKCFVSVILERCCLPIYGTQKMLIMKVIVFLVTKISIISDHRTVL